MASMSSALEQPVWIVGVPYHNTACSGALHLATNMLTLLERKTSVIYAPLARLEAQMPMAAALSYTANDRCAEQNPSYFTLAWRNQFKKRGSDDAVFTVQPAILLWMKYDYQKSNTGVDSFKICNVHQVILR
jgi:hypothetical protein